MSPRLSRLSDVSGMARLPGYDPAKHGTGIVHLGAGAFHRAHQAVFTDDALALAGGDWRITGVSLRSTAVAEDMNPQNGLYTLIERGSTGDSARVIAAIDRVLAGAGQLGQALALMADPNTRIVSMTVTEKAYGIDRAALCADTAHPAVAADLARPDAPTGVLGLLVAALRQRRAAGVKPFTVLCCDNLPDNGALLRAGVVDFARRIDPDLARWIEGEVAFPSTMVDRITPASTDRTRADALAFTGCEDHAAIETEPFTQWVIENHFAQGHPAWDAAGALFVSDVQPYELMKLRMLNGAHSALAYSGFMAGCEHVRDVMARPDFHALVNRLMWAAQATLPDLTGIDLDGYRRSLLARFENRAIAHKTAQIAMDGTQKLPQRLLAPAVTCLATGGDIGAYAFAVAAWMRFCLGRGEDGRPHDLNDPRQDEIGQALTGAATAQKISTVLHGLPGLFPDGLRDNPDWRRAVEDRLERMLQQGMAAAVNQERV